MATNRSRGRPAGGSDARQRLLDAAQHAFTKDGYEGATLRSIARRAGTDVALIGYHFGSKVGLFVAAMALTVAPSEVLAQTVAGAEDDLADRLLAAVLKSWEDPQRGPAMRAFVVAALAHPDVLRAFREYIEREVMQRASAAFSGPEAPQRAVAVITVVVGVIFSRYILELGPVAALPPRGIHTALAPALRAATHPPRPRRRHH
ncbi:MAG: TetR family transcriptional regulator [Propioniciclava sp.]